MTISPPPPSGILDGSPSLADLRTAVGGRLHTPADHDWDDVRTPWLLHVEQQPCAVLDVAGVDDVRTAVRWAARHGVAVAAQPTGHGATGTADGSLLLRTRRLGGIRVDVERRTAWIGSGIRAGELLAALDGTGLVYLGGSHPGTSVVGVTLTGGLGWFSRLHGIGADSVVSVDLVDGTGRSRTVCAAEQPELFWALRGGGGDFGIVTGMELRLHPVPQLYGGRLMWPAERMREVLLAFRAVTSSAPRELSTWFQVTHFPALPHVPEQLRGRSFTSVALAHVGPGEAAERLLAPLRAVPGAVLDTVGEVPLAALGTITDEPVDPMPAMDSSALLTTIDDQLVDDLVATVGPGSGTPLAMVQLRHLGGALTEEQHGGGCFGPVPERYLLFTIGVAGVPTAAAPVRAAFAGLDDITARCASGRTMPAFLGERSSDAWWSAATRARLVAAKAAADPAGVIRSNRPVAAR